MLESGVASLKFGIQVDILIFVRSAICELFLQKECGVLPGIGIHVEVQLKRFAQTDELERVQPRSGYPVQIVRRINRNEQWIRSRARARKNHGPRQTSEHLEHRPVLLFAHFCRQRAEKRPVLLAYPVDERESDE